MPLSSIAELLRALSCSWVMREESQKVGRKEDEVSDLLRMRGLVPGKRKLVFVGSGWGPRLDSPCV